MKKKLIAIFGCLVVAIATRALANWVYSAYLVNGVVSTTQNYVLNLQQTPNASGITHLSAQAVYSQSAPTTSTFTDGRASTGSFNVASNTGLVPVVATNSITFPSTALLTPAKATANLTVSSNSALAGQYIVVNGAILQDSIFTTSTASGTATGLASYLNKYYSNQFVSTAPVNATVVYSTASAAGTNGNLFTITSSTPALTITGFSGGTNSALQNARIKVNGTDYRVGYLWQDTGISSTTAQSFHDNVLQFIPGIISTVTAGTSVIYATATVAGTAGNSFTFSASTVAVTFGSLNFTGGQNGAQVCIAGNCVVEGTNWNVGGSVNATAHNIAAALNANSAIGAITASSASISGLVTSTATSVGTSGNYAIRSSTPAAIVPSGSAMTGGSNSSYLINTPTINLPSHGLATGYDVVFTTTSGLGLSPLSPNATYYVIAVDANDIQLATTSTGAVAGAYITLTSSSIAGPHSYTLTPGYYSGTAGMQWQVSNDCINFNPLSVSSITYSSPSTTPSSTIWDLGAVNFACAELSVQGPSSGGFNLAVKVNGR